MKKHYSHFHDRTGEEIKNNQGLKMKICKYNNDGIVITALKDGCSFNGFQLEVGRQYSIKFAKLDRTGNDGSEYFMQKQCAFYLNGIEDNLIKELEKIIEKGE